MAELWFVRHAQTESNAHPLSHVADANKLSDLGRLQAEKLAARLCKEEHCGGAFQRVIVSDLQRAKATLEPWKESHQSQGRAVQEIGRPTSVGMKDVESSSAVRERSSGRYEGRMLTEKRQAAASGQPIRSWRPPGGESWDDVMLRASHFLADVLTDLQGCSTATHRQQSRILVLTHGGFIRELLNATLDGPLREHSIARNTSIFVLRASWHGNDGHAVRSRLLPGWHFTLLLENDTTHLEDSEMTGGDDPLSKQAVDEVGVHCRVHKHSSMGIAIVSLEDMMVRREILRVIGVGSSTAKASIAGVPVELRPHRDKATKQEVLTDIFVAWGHRVEKATPLSEHDIAKFFDEKHCELAVGGKLNAQEEPDGDESRRRVQESEEQEDSLQAQFAKVSMTSPTSKSSDEKAWSRATRDRLETQRKSRGNGKGKNQSRGKGKGKQQQGMAFAKGYNQQ